MVPHPQFDAMPTTIFEQMSLLANQSGAINLGQGFPEGSGPLELRQAAAQAVVDGWNQYAPSRGMPPLRQAVAEHYNRLHKTHLDAEQVLITSGATEALAAAILAWVRPGDDVIIFEPAYDAYRPLIERAGGVVRSVVLKPPHWRLERGTLERAITPATRMVLFNNPMNPAARVFDRQELEVLASLCVAHDLVALTDEVWEHVVFDGRTHVPLASIAGMQARTIKIGSAGKMFGMTGWKVGFVCAPAMLLDPVARAHQFLTFATPPMLQTAVAQGLGWGVERFDQMRQTLCASRLRLKSALEAAGYVCLDSQGAYFLNIDLKQSGLDIGDVDFCHLIVREFGVAAIPVSAFVSGQEQGQVVRLCFAKSDPVLDLAADRLKQARLSLLSAV